MKKLITVCAVVVLFLCISQASFGTITINVTASSAPNTGTPVWNGYAANALYALENGLSTNGDRSTNPTGYEAAPAQVDPWEIAVTSFKSWRGTVNPTGAFANEHGNRMHFGLHAIGDGTTQFALNDLTFALHSSDAGVYEGVPWSDTLVYVGDFIGYNYNGTTRYGINWGTDRVKGGGDDVVYTLGNGTTLVDEIVYVGVGNAWWPGGDDPNPSNPAGGAQAAMDDYFAWVASEQPIDVTCSYSILGSTGSDMVTVVPEPATVCLLGLGALGLLRKRRA
jgi:hypothetical protein